MASMDPYIVKEEEGKFVVYEKHPRQEIKLQVCDTKEEAEHVIDQWKARDKLSEKVEEFVDEVMDEFSGMLDRSEIIKQIKGELPTS